MRRWKLTAIRTRVIVLERINSIGNSDKIIMSHRTRLHLDFCEPKPCENINANKSIYYSETAISLEKINYLMNDEIASRIEWVNNNKTDFLVLKKIERIEVIFVHFWDKAIWISNSWNLLSWHAFLIISFINWSYYFYLKR